jgi:hypothetical protein
MRWPAPAVVWPDAVRRSSRPADVCTVLEFGRLHCPVGSTLKPDVDVRE